jgi:hypothetical protein
VRGKRGRLLFGAAVAVLVAGVAAVTVLALNQSHHVLVVRVVTRRPNTSTSSKPRSEPRSEYPASPGAASLESVRQALAKEGAGSTSAEDASSDGGSGLLSVGASRSFARLAAGLPGRIELAVTPLGAGKTELLGRDEAAHGWSTTKVPVLTSLLRARGTRGLTAQEKQWAQSAIKESNNESVLALFGDLERLKGGLEGASLYMQEVLRLSGDDETVVATASPPAGAVTTFGQTEWKPVQAVKFFRALALGCLLPSAATGYVLGLMEHVVPSESWGLGSAGFGAIAFKGGWGPEPGGYLVRQSGIIDPGSTSGAAVSIVSFAPSFAAGTEVLTRTATWLRAHIALSGRPRTGCSPA